MTGIQRMTEASTFDQVLVSEEQLTHEAHEATHAGRAAERGVGQDPDMWAVLEIGAHAA